MLNYYLGLALRSLRRNTVLTVLMIAAIGVGIGASMTTLTIFRAMSGDPIPHKSDQLYVPQIDNWGPDNVFKQSTDLLPIQLSYLDAMAWMKAGAAKRQTALYAAALPLKIFLDMLGVELQVSACSDAADLALLHPLIKSFEITAEDGCGFSSMKTRLLAVVKLLTTKGTRP